MVHVWYAFPATGIFATDRQTGTRRERKKERERKREERDKIRSTKGRRLFYGTRLESQWTISRDVLRKA